MFRLKSLSISNVRSVEHLTIDIDPAGTTALYGPSGVGKSGILDAVPWCLWGDSNAGPVRREGSTEPAEVRATLEIGEDEWVVTRRQTRSKSGSESTSAKLTINGVAQTGVTASSLTKMVTERTGLTSKKFRSGFYMPQDQLTALVTSPPSKVQETFEELTGLDQLTRVIAESKDNHKAARIRADALPGDPEQAARATEAAEEAQTESTRLQHESDEAAARAATARALWKQADQLARGLQTQHTDAQASRNAVVAAHAVLDDAAAALTMATTTLTNVGANPALNAATEVATGRDLLRRWESELTDLRNKGGTLKAATDAASAAAQAVTDAEQDTADISVAAATTDLVAAENDVRGTRAAVAAAERVHTLAESARDRLSEASTLLNSLQAGTACCPTCQQTLPDPALTLAEVKLQLAEADSAVRDAVRSLRTARAADVAAERSLEHARTTVTAAQLRESALDHVRADADAAVARRCAAANALATTVTAIAGRTAPTDPDAVRDAALKTFAWLSKRRDTAQERLTAWEMLNAATERVALALNEVATREKLVQGIPDAAELAAAVAEADRAREEFEASNAVASEASAHALAAKVSTIQLVDLADDARTKWARKQHAEAEAEDLLTVKALLIALRRDLLAEYCETISSAASDVMGRLGGEHVGFHLDSSFVPQVVLADGSARATRQLSGGEKARAAVCAFIGISRQLTGGGKPAMLICDEITSSQDEPFRREILTMLRALEMPMIVVSHTADVLDIATQVIRLERPLLGATQIAA